MDGQSIMTDHTTISVDGFCKQLRDRGLLANDLLEKSIKQWQAETKRPDSAEQFGDWLVGKGLISEFHAEALLSGIDGPIVIGPYEVAERVVSGNLGGVYRARHCETGQPVSLKVFPSQQHTTSEQAARIKREVRLLSQLNHPNVVRAFDYGEAHGVRYVAFEDLSGETLDVWLGREGAMDYHDACRFALDIAEGLGVLHERGIVHRDVCPDTIWIDHSGRAKLLEFGAAKDTSAHSGDEAEGLTTDSTVIGRYDYMSPEQAKDARSVTAASDLFSLGATLYHCLAGKAPFHDPNPMRVMMKVVTEQPAPVSSLPFGIPRELDDVIAGMLAKDSAKRFQKAQDVIRGLRPFASVLSDAEPEQPAELDPAFLEWVQSSSESPSVGLDPNLARFFTRMAHRDERRARSRTQS